MDIIFARIKNSKTRLVFEIFLEQFIYSGGNWLLFIVIAQTTDIKVFGLFSVYWVTSQFYQGLISQYVYAPLSSFPVKKDMHACLSKFLIQRLFKSFMIVPAIVFSSMWIMLEPEYYRWTGIITLHLLSLAIALSDYCRLYFIRLKQRDISVRFGLLRWGISYTLIAVFTKEDLLSVDTIALSIFTGVAISILFLGRNIWNTLNSKISMDSSQITRIRKFSSPLIIYGVVTAIIGIAAYSMVNRWVGIAALGAFVAIRSLSGFIAIPIQIINTHLAAYYLHSGVRRDLSSSILLLFCGTSLTIVLLIWAWASEIIGYFYGEAYQPFSLLLPITVGTALMQICSSYFASQLRVLGDTRVYHGWIWVSLTLLIPMCILTYVWESVYVASSLMMLIAIIQAFLSFIALSKLNHE